MTERNVCRREINGCFIHLQALEDKKMRSYAVIPPLMLDSEQKKYPFMNENGLLTDIVAEAKVSCLSMCP